MAAGRDLTWLNRALFGERTTGFWLQTKHVCDTGVSASGLALTIRGYTWLSVGLKLQACWRRCNYSGVVPSARAIKSLVQLYRPPRMYCNTLSHRLYLFRYAARVFSRLSAFCALFYVTIVRQLKLNPHARTCSARRACLKVLPVRLPSYSAFRAGQVVF